MLNTIEEAIKDLKNGKVVIVVDDENRENEGDFVYPAEIIKPEIVNFMATHGRGLICVPLTSKRCAELDLKPMVTNNTEIMDTAFTISVDLKGKGVSSGISAEDRSKTIKALADPNTISKNLSRPGHIFPIEGIDGGVLRRSGHTEASIDLSRLAGFSPYGVICEIMNEDGTMARLPQLIKVAEKFDLKIVSIEKLIEFRMRNDSLIELTDKFEIETLYGKFILNTFNQNNNNLIHLALSKGSWIENDSVLCKVSSLNSINKVIDDLVLYENKDLKQILELINKNKSGVVVFINQDHESKIIKERLSKLKINQIKGKRHKPFKKMDSKDFGIGAQILQKLEIKKISLLTSSMNKTKKVGMKGYGLEIVENIKI